MTSEVDWVLSQFADVATTISNEYTLESGDPVELRRVDRDESRILEGDVQSIRGELQSASYIGATHVDTSETPMGSEYNLQREVVVGVRLTGLTSSKYGHIDPEGDEGIPFDELVERCKDALYSERKWPDAGPTDVSYPHLELQNEVNTSQQWADFYRADWDVVFSNGFHDLS